MQTHPCECVLVLLRYRAPLCHLQSWSQMVSKPPRPPLPKRALVMAFCCLIQGMNSRGNLGARGKDWPWRPSASAEWPARVRGTQTDVLWVLLQNREEYWQTEQLQPAARKFCPVSWHHRHGLLCEVHPIQEWGNSFLLLFPEIYRISHLKCFFINRLLQE